ncbi:MAG: glycoside hydrolase family 18 protein, partial [Psychromonas sp.]|nr:glycoside hydrolase family 18 protein [Psychromonas sp.]
MQIKLNKSLLSLAISGIFLSSSAIAAPVEKAEYQYFTGQHDSYLQTSDKIVGSYVANWANPTIVDGINGDNLSHIIYAFLTICGESQASSVNTICINKADFQLAEDNSSVDKAFSSKFSDLKKQYPHLKILPSVGGWGLSDMFAPMTHAPESRAIFVQSVVQYLQNNPAFDGIDIDWEWPQSSAEGQGYVDLMKDLRSAFDQLSMKTGREYQITSALSTTQSHIQHVDYVKASSYMDYIFMMTYDFTGAWSMTNIGHHTALKNHSANTWGHSADAGTHNMLNAGIPAEKLVLGVAKYARGFNGVTLSEQGTVLGGQATGVFPKKVKPWHADGVAIYSRVANDILGPQGTGINGFEIIYDAECECTYAWRDSDKAFVGFDHPRDVINKAEYANNNNLAGVFSWEYGQDNGDILNAMNHGIGNLLKTTVENNLPPVIDAKSQISVDSNNPVIIQASVSDPDVANQLLLTSSHGQITQMGPDATIFFDA